MKLKDNWLILGLCLIVTAININKAYHIDDAFHLESAQWIWQHPLTPMSGQINWYDNNEDMHHFNQPPLLFFLIAIVGGLFGYSEPVLHLIIAFFCWLSIWYFNRLLLHFNSRHRYYLLSIFALCPAFIVNQNLMTDIPILSFEMGFLYHYMQNEHRKKNLIISMLFLGAALLIKYSMIPLLLAAIIGLVIRKEFILIPIVFIPVFMLLLWTAWNKLEYGGVHIQDRPKNEISLKLVYEQLIALLSCIGSVLPIPFLFWNGIKPSRIWVYLSLLFMIAFGTFSILVYFEKIQIHPANTILNGIFIVIGAFMVLALLIYLVKGIKAIAVDKQIEPHFPFAILTIMLGAMTLFLLLYAPFMATRHLLLLMPFLFLLMLPVLNLSLGSIWKNALFSVAFLGIVLGISDWMYADFYRTMPAKVKVKPGAWTVGHWGWQWYAKQQGFKFYSKDSSVVELGDEIVFPRHISKQVLDTGTIIKEIGEYTYKPTIGTFFSVHNFASMYNSYYNKPSWEFSKVYIDTVVTAQIIGLRPRKWAHSK